MATTVKEVEKLMKKPGRHGVGQGLYLEVDKKGRQSWVYIYTRNGRRREMGLGSAREGAVTLAQARAKRDAARGLLAQGTDPLDAKREAAPPAESAPGDDAPAAQASKVPTFREMAATFIADRESGWRNAKHRAQWRMTLGLTTDKKTGKPTGYCLGLAGKPVNEITAEDVKAELAPLWAKKQETASRIRSRIEMVLSAAKVLGHRDGPNPAAWRDNLEHLLGKRKKLQRGHHPAMPYGRLPEFMVTLRAAKGVSPRCLELTILAACRSGESRMATRREVDLDAACWTVPAGRMKGEREHLVPLSRQAVALLREQLRYIPDDPEALIFPSLKDTPLSDMALLTCMDRIGAGEFTPHGMRSSFRDWCGDETDYERETAEQALAHVIGGTEGAYRRGTAYRKRQALMQLWADYLDGKPATEGARPAKLLQLRRRRLAIRRHAEPANTPKAA